MINRLKPCPFCGSKTVDVARTNPGACWIICARCGAESYTAPTREGAFKNWNKRRTVKGYARVRHDDDLEDRNG